MHQVLEEAEIPFILKETCPQELLWPVGLGFLHGRAAVSHYQVSLIAKEVMVGVEVGAGRQKGSSWYLLQVDLLHWDVLLRRMGTARLGRRTAFTP